MREKRGREERLNPPSRIFFRFRWFARTLLRFQGVEEGLQEEGWNRDDDDPVLLLFFRRDSETEREGGKKVETRPWRRRI